jgi:hypothetical protein
MPYPEVVSFATFTLPLPVIYFVMGEFTCMQARNIVVAGSAGGIVIFLLMVISGFLVNLILPTDMNMYGGMRSANDPVMNLFYLYPFVIAFVSALVFDQVRDCLKGDRVTKGLMYGAILLAIITIPGLYVMFTSMTWPVDFYISTGLWEIVSFPLLGIMYAKIWNL